MLINYQLTPKNNSSKLVAKIAKELGLKTTVTFDIQTLNNENVFIYQYNVGITQLERKAIDIYCQTQRHRLVLWINNFTEFLENNDMKFWLSIADFIVVPSWRAKRFLIKSGISNNILGVLPLRDCFSLQKPKKVPPFSNRILHLEQAQTIATPLLVKTLNTTGGIALASTNSLYDLPAKFSIYIEAGIPILVKEGTALSDVVTQYKIGWSYKSNTNINDAITNITKTQYEKCSKNELNLASKLLTGDFIRHILVKALQNVQFQEQSIINFGSLYRPNKYDLMVMDSSDTLAYIMEQRCSVARFGDGEISLLNGVDQVFQDADPILENRLDKILKAGSKPGLLVCLSDVFHGLDMLVDSARDWWKGHLVTFNQYYQELGKIDNYYGNTMVTRPYMDFKDRSSAGKNFDCLKKLWDGRDLLIVEGYYTRSGVGNDLYSRANSVKRVICPSKNAWEKFDEIKNMIKLYGQNRLVLVMLGMTSTVLAADLAECTQIIDLGHLDSEYEWYKMGAKYRVPIKGKHTAEMNYDVGIEDIDNQKYQSEIIAKVGIESHK